MLLLAAVVLGRRAAGQPERVRSRRQARRM